LPVALTLVVLGCGGSTTMMTPPPPPAMSGSFGMAAVSTGPDTFLIGGPIQSNAGGSVSGTVRVDSSTSTCFDFFTPITLNGSISSTGQLSLTSSIYNLQTINIMGTLSADGKTISGGTFNITGGCAAGIHGTLSGFQVALINGSYNGTFMAAGSSMGISVKLSQGATPDTAFGLSGSANFTNGSACGLSSLNITAFETGFIAGADVRTTMMDSTLTPVAGFRGVAVDGSARIIRGTLGIASGPCAGTSVLIDLNLP
jgi:hypothetical protein